MISRNYAFISYKSCHYYFKYEGPQMQQLKDDHLKITGVDIENVIENKFVLYFYKNVQTENRILTFKTLRKIP